jgi:hypothetical protein
VQNLLWLNRFLIQNMSVLIPAWIFCFQLSITSFSFDLLYQSTYTYFNFMKLSSIWYIVTQISRCFTTLTHSYCACKKRIKFKPAFTIMWNKEYI